jgi:hypothetical protein
MKSKTWSYPISAKVVEIKSKKVVITAMTQLYRTGVYVCLEGPDGNPRRQLNLRPRQVIKCMNEFKTSNLAEGLMCEFGRIIQVNENEDGLLNELTNETGTI